MKCRLCHSGNVFEIKSLGNFCVDVLYDSNTYSDPHFPLNLLFCSDCHSMFLDRVVDSQRLYKKFYWHQAGLTHTLTNAHQALASKLEKRFPLQMGDIVLDIGSNDGTLLRAFNVPGITKVGIEPADNCEEEGKSGIDFFLHSFWDQRTYERYVGKKAQIITLTDVLSHIRNPDFFLQNLSEILEEKGVLLIQDVFLTNMLITRDFGNIHHEHVHYFSLSSLERLLDNVGIEVFDIEIQPLHNQSYRIYCAKKGRFSVEKEKIDQVRKQDAASCLPEAIKEFFKSVEIEKKNFWMFYDEEKKKNKVFAGYGVSREGMTLLQSWGITEKEFPFTVDWSRDFISKKVCQKFPCVDVREGRCLKPDYYVVLNQTLINEIYKFEEEWRLEGGKLIILLPKFRVIS